MPAPHDPPHRHRTPGPRLLGLVLLTALALAAAMIRWANDPEIANPDFIAWAVSDTEHHVDGFTLTELDLEGWLYVIGRDGSGNDVERAYTLRGLFDDSTNRSADSPTVPLRADAGLYEHLAIRAPRGPPPGHRSLLQPAAHNSHEYVVATNRPHQLLLHTSSGRLARRERTAPKRQLGPHGG